MREAGLPSPAVIVGVGEIGGVFARGVLATGRPVYPIVRGSDPERVVAGVPEPAMVVIAVAETALHPVLATLPKQWADSVVLVQNELLPRDWTAHGLVDPTVISIWFEKKPGRAVKVIIPSPVAGPRASIVAEALDAVGVPTRIIPHGPELTFELVRKNLYILVANIAGLRTGGTVADLWARHRELASAVASDVLAIQRYLTGSDLDEPSLLAGMVEAFDADPDHQTTGRSAPARLARALDHADEASLEVATLRAIARSEGLTT